MGSWRREGIYCVYLPFSLPPSLSVSASLTFPIIICPTIHISSLYCLLSIAPFSLSHLSSLSLYFSLYPSLQVYTSFSLSSSPFPSSSLSISIFFFLSALSLYLSTCLPLSPYIYQYPSLYFPIYMPISLFSLT